MTPEMEARFDGLAAFADWMDEERRPLRSTTMTNENDADTLREVLFRMAEDVTRIKRVCTQEHPPKMASPASDWPAGTETRHSDGTVCVLLNDGDWALVPTCVLPPAVPTTTDPEGA